MYIWLSAGIGWASTPWYDYGPHTVFAPKSAYRDPASISYFFRNFFLKTYYLSVTPVLGLFFEAKNRTIFKQISSKEISKSALPVLWSGLIHPPIQSLVKLCFSQTFEQLFSTKPWTVKSQVPTSNLGIDFRFLSSNDCDPFGTTRITWISSLAQDLHGSGRHESGIRTVPLPGTLACAAPSADADSRVWLNSTQTYTKMRNIVRDAVSMLFQKMNKSGRELRKRRVEK